jgi:hypothetical protein
MKRTVREAMFTFSMVAERRRLLSLSAALSMNILRPFLLETLPWAHPLVDRPEPEAAGHGLAVTRVIFGAAKLHQLEDNLGAVRVKLAEQEIATLDAATVPAKVYPNWFHR